MHDSCVKRNHQFAGIELREGCLKATVRLLQCTQYTFVAVKRLFQNSLDIMVECDRIFHVHHKALPCPARFQRQKALSFQNLRIFFSHTALFGAENGIGRIIAQSFGKGFRQKNLLQFVNPRMFPRIAGCCQHNFPRSMLPDIAGGSPIAKLAVKFCSGKRTPDNRAFQTRFPFMIQHNRHTGIFLRERLQKGRGSFCAAQPAPKLFLPFPACSKMDNFHSLCLQKLFILRFAQIKAVFINIILCHRVNEVGNIAVIVNVFPNARRTDVLKMRRQFQFNNAALYGGIGIVVPLRAALSAFPPKQDMREGMDGVFLRFFAVRRSVLHHIAPRHHIDLFLRKQSPQLLQIGRVGNVYRNIFREKIDVFLVRNGNIQYLPPHHMRLCFFRPRKFVQRKINHKAHIANFSGNLLMPQRKGVECTGKKRHTPRLLKAERAIAELVITDKAVNMVPCHRIVEERQFRRIVAPT